MMSFVAFFGAWRSKVCILNDIFVPNANAIDSACYSVFVCK